VIGLLLGGVESRLVFLILVPILSFWEFSKMSKFGIQDWLVSFLIVGGYTALCYYKGASSQNYLAFTMVGINLLLIGNLFFSFLNLDRAKALLGSIYIVLPFVLAVFLEWQVPVYILLSAVILIWVSDSAAYFVGSQLGKRKLFPSVSPKKTWEGLWGACMITLIASYILYSYFALGTMRDWVIFGLVAWGIGSLGDLIASQFKRYFKIKDSGTILPGHGGFYDRFDGFIFIIPFLILLIEYINILQ